jgi:membrane-bound lytic murein transglycosylase D
MKHKPGVIPFISAILILISLFASADNPDNNKTLLNDTTETCLVKDDPIISMLDSLSLSTYLNNFKFSTDTSILNIHHFSVNFIPSYPDSVYIEKFKKLNMTSPCNLIYNEDVKKYIDVYAVKKRNLTSRLLGLAQLYFPVFEPVLDKYNIPLEIKYLAIVESALNPLAVSPARAAGMWQFIASTGKLYNLNKTQLVDDRFDIFKSTEAACRHIADLYDIFHNWELALAAYNAGAGAVSRAIVKAGYTLKKTTGIDFESIKHFLPRETRAYVPAFIAVNYIMNYAADHNIYPLAPAIFNHDIDTVTVKRKLTFEQLSEFLKIPYEYIALLNPSFRKGIIPADNNFKYTLRLPKDNIADFINNEEYLYTYTPAKPNKYESIARTKKNYDSGSSNGYHIVRKGDTLSKIANRYNCSISELRVWNKLRTVHIKPGQKLFVLNPKEFTSYNN